MMLIWVRSRKQMHGLQNKFPKFLLSLNFNLPAMASSLLFGMKVNLAMTGAVQQ